MEDSVSFRSIRDTSIFLSSKLQIESREGSNTSDGTHHHKFNRIWTSTSANHLLGIPDNVYLNGTKLNLAYLVVDVKLLGAFHWNRNRNSIDKNKYYILHIVHLDKYAWFKIEGNSAARWALIWVLGERRHANFIHLILLYLDKTSSPLSWQVVFVHRISYLGWVL